MNKSINRVPGDEPPPDSPISARLLSVMIAPSSELPSRRAAPNGASSNIGSPSGRGGRLADAASIRLSPSSRLCEFAKTIVRPVASAPLPFQVVIVCTGTSTPSRERIITSARPGTPDLRSRRSIFTNSGRIISSRRTFLAASGKPSSSRSQPFAYEIVPSAPVEKKPIGASSTYSPRISVAPVACSLPVIRRKRHITRPPFSGETAASYCTGIASVPIVIAGKLSRRDSPPLAAFDKRKIGAAKPGAALKIRSTETGPIASDCPIKAVLARSE